MRQGEADASASGRTGTEPRFRGRFGTLAILGVVLVIAIATAFVLATLRSYADERRQAEISLARLEGQANLQTALKWQAIGQQRLTAELTDQVLEARGRMAEALSQLSWTDRGGQSLARVDEALNVYQVAVNEALGLIAEGDIEKARALTQERVDPAFQALTQAIEESSANYDDSASRTNRAAEIGSVMALFSAAILIILLFRKSERSRRAADRVAGEQKGLEQSERRFRSLVQNSSDAVTVVDPDGTVRYQSSSVEHLLGYAAEELTGRKLTQLMHPDDVRGAVEFLASVVRSGEGSSRVEWRLHHRDGTWITVDTIASNLLEEPTVRGIVLNIRNVSDRKALEAQLTHQAFHDSLTGLPNRSFFLHRLETALKQRDREPGSVGVLFLDVDEFKAVNDTLGHSAGDEVLVNIAKRLQGCLRPGDTAARLAGDEFAILLEDTLGVEGATAVAQRLVAVMESPFAVRDKRLSTHVSVGVAVQTDAGQTADELLRNADVAMYAAKAAGKGRYEVFQPRMHEEARARAEFGADLAGALERGEFLLHYQPIVHLATGTVTGVEALLRWQHPERGPVPPAAFIPLAEESGQILAIGDWVLREACRQASAWGRAYPREGGLGVSVNVSARQLHERTIVDQVARALDDHHLPRGSLTLEITESTMMQDPETVARRLSELKELGVRLAIDDFGTGYSSLGYLRRFPLDALKIDKSFVDGVGNSSHDAELVRAIVSLAHTLGLRTVAEGIENVRQLRQLRGLACDEGQGYYLSRPLPAGEFRSVLADPVRLPAGTAA